MRDPAEAIELLAADPAAAGLCCDFDGTLAPIVADPAAAQMPAELRPVLADLVDRLGALAVVSGRPAAFLMERVSVPGVRLLGLYGLERVDDGIVVARPETAEWQPVVRAAVPRLRAALAGEPGVHVEDKGRSVAVHWRAAPDHDVAEREVGLVAASLAADTELAVEVGKLVLELRPPVDWDKGAAVRALTREAGLSRVVYVGDDLGDLVAFAAAREIGGMAVAVSGGAETPPELLAAADCVLHGTAAVHAWLTALHHRLTRTVSDPRRIGPSI